MYVPLKQVRIVFSLKDCPRYDLRLIVSHKKSIYHNIQHALVNYVQNI